MPKELGKLLEADAGDKGGGEEPEWGGVHAGDYNSPFATGGYRPMNEAAGKEVMKDVRKYGGK